MYDRSELLFSQAIKSEATRQSYHYGLNGFLKFHNIKSQDVLVLDHSEIQIMVEDYVFSMKNRGVGKSTIRSYLAGLKLFLDMSDVVVNWTKIRKFMPEASRKSGQKAYTNEDVRELLHTTVNKKYRALVHVLASSGMRIGEVRHLRIRDLEDMPHGCKSVLVSISKSKDERFTFISSEAVKALDEYLDERKLNGDKINSESFLFATSYKGFQQCSETGMKMVMAKQVQKLNRKAIDGKRYDKMMNHAFRKRFNTILKSNQKINIVLAERMMGHSVTIPLDNSYLDVSKENLFAEYLKALPELYIDEKYKLEAELIEKQQQIEELESKDNKIRNLELQMQEMKAHFENIISKS
ncbi:site-specific integrase [Candidatus Nitrosopelagicus sp.]|nr:site-specific integrase [Candidatus Nitrosopelagicus sp.]